MIVVKFHENGVVSICDEDVLGKYFEDDLLSLDVNERFYRGKPCDKKEVLVILADAKSLNLVGKHAVQIALDGGFVFTSDILYIQGVPHVQIYAFH